MRFHTLLTLWRRYILVRQSGLFDHVYYIEANDNVTKSSSFQALLHFLTEGAPAGANPHPLFNTSWYLEQNPQLKTNNENPLIHYLEIGVKEGCNPNPYFDSKWYLDQNKDVARSGQNPLVHYLKHGAKEERDPSTRFSTKWYVDENKDVRNSSLNPLGHFLRYGKSEGRSPTRGTLHIDSFVNITLQNDGSLEFTNGDPQLHISVLRKACSNQICLIFSVQLFSEGNLDPRLYADYGAGFSEESSFELRKVDENRWEGFLPLPFMIKSLRFDPSSKRGRATLGDLSLREFNINECFDQLLSVDSGTETITQLVRNTLRLAMRKRGTATASHALFSERAVAHVCDYVAKSINPQQSLNQIKYNEWIAAYDTVTSIDKEKMLELLPEMRIKPTFSIIIPVYNTNQQLLREAIASVLTQTYPYFEICIADDASPDARVRNVIEEAARNDSRIKYVFRDINGHISECSNTALSLATGDYIVLLDHDDIIPVHSLWVVAYYINLHPNGQIFFSDEDKIDEDGLRQDPYFKGEFDQYLLYGHNMVSHLGIYKRSLIESIGGFRKGFEGSQDYDLTLRCFEKCEADQIVHIPHILYHWRMVAGSTAISADQKSYAIIAAQKAINEHFKRTALPFVSVDGRVPGNTAIAELKQPNTIPSLVSIIIPTRNGGEYLCRCVESIDLNDPSIELIIVDNGSTETETLEYLNNLNNSQKARVLKYPYEFNFSKINNFAAEYATGQILCFLNDDTEVISEKWLSRARTFLSVSTIGIVGARLLYPDGTLQHFGIHLGLGPHKVVGTPHVGQEASEPGYFSKGFLTQQFSAVTAACLFIRRSDFLAIGGFEPQLGVAYNDIDLCLKIRQLGLKIVCDADIELIHKESKTRGADTTPERKERLDKEAKWMRQKWGAILDSDPFFSPNFDKDRNDYSLAFPPRIPLPWKIN